MKKRFDKNVGVLLGTILAFAFGAFFVSGIGVGYTQTIEIYPGQTLDETLSLQNLPTGEGDLVFVGEIQQGNEVMSFPEGNEFEVPEGRVRHAPIRLSVAEDESIGSLIPIQVLFRTRSAQSVEGNVQLNPGAGISFNVLVVEEPAQPTEIPEPISGGFGGSFWVWLIIIVVVILIIWMVMKGKKK